MNKYFIAAFDAKIWKFGFGVDFRLEHMWLSIGPIHFMFDWDPYNPISF